ncbi:MULTISPECIES: transposase [Shigella]|uniref:transposase n=3 Tax=Enterobacteriaceae TaxID=543 RepID=UPI0020930722|nr:MULTISPECIES: transposase [Shigella]
MQKNVNPGRRKGCPNYPPEFKQQLVAASCEPGISISKLALENGINANLLFKWRQQWREGKLLLPSSESPQLLPVTPRCSCRTARIARRGSGNPQYQL